MYMILFSNEFLGRYHESIETHDDAKRCSDAYGEPSIQPNKQVVSIFYCLFTISCVFEKVEGEDDNAYRYCSFSSVSMVMVRGSP